MKQKDVIAIYEILRKYPVSAYKHVDGLYAAPIMGHLMYWEGTNFQSMSNKAVNMWILKNIRRATLINIKEIK